MSNELKRIAAVGAVAFPIWLAVFLIDPSMPSWRRISIYTLLGAAIFGSHWLMQKVK